MAEDVVELSAGDTAAVFDVINTAAERYRGVIPEESDTDPYMPMAQVEEVLVGMRVLGVVEKRLVGVIGVQERAEVTLIRHLYVRPGMQGQGIGTTLLEAGIERADSSEVLVGTWQAADWAIGFYEANGFENLGPDRDRLSRYWDVPEHQLTASVVLRYSADD